MISVGNIPFLSHINNPGGGHDLIVNPLGQFRPLIFSDLRMIIGFQRRCRSSQKDNGSSSTKLWYQMRMSQSAFTLAVSLAAFAI